MFFGDNDQKERWCLKKRVILLVLSLLMVICICGCNGKTEEVIILDETSSMTSALLSDDATISDGGEVSDAPTVSEGDSTVTAPTTSDGTTSKQPINIDYNTVVEVDICNDYVRAYLDSNDAATQYYWLNQIGSQKFDYQNLNLTWVIDDSNVFTIYFSEKSDFSNAITIKSKNSYSNEIDASILVPGKTYYWKVVGENSTDALGGGKIKVVDSPVRWIYIDGIRNVRDMGGWKTASGKTVKYGMLYRGAQLNTEKNGSVVNAVTERGLETFNKLGIKTEFDLRSMQNVHVQTTGTQLNYVLFSDEGSAYSAYNSIAASTQKEKYKKMFEYLSNESNYPIYTHCQGGADRTGTYAFLLNGLLGVSYEDLTRDFELTSFSGTQRWRSAGSGNSFNPSDGNLVDGTVTVKWKDMYDYIMEYGAQNKCTTLQQTIEHWFINYVGIPKSQIDSFKAIMLE